MSQTEAESEAFQDSSAQNSQQPTTERAVDTDSPVPTAATADDNSNAVTTAVSEEKEEQPASFATAVISLVNSTLGSGMLGIPLAYSKAGLVPAITLHIIMALMSWASFYFLTYSSEATGVYSYGELGYRTFGHYGTLVNEVSTFIYTFGPLWSYCIMMGDFLPSVLHGAGVPEDTWYTNRVFIIVMLAFFVVQPLSWLRSLNSLRYTSFFGMVSMMFCVLVICIRYFATASNIVNKEDVEAVHKSPSMIQTFSTLCFAFGCQQNVPIIHGEIYEKSTKSMNFIAVWSVAIVGIFYMLAGIFGYLTFTSFFRENDNSGNVLNLYQDKDWLVFVARLASLVTVIFCCPMNSLPARVALYNIFDSSRALYQERKEKKQNKQADVEMTSETSEGSEATHSDKDTPTKPKTFVPSRPSWWNKKFLCLTGEVWVSCIVGSVMVFLAVLLAVFLAKLEFVFDFLGSTAGVAVAFMVPAAVYIRIIRHPEIYLDLNRNPNTKRPEGLILFHERNERMKAPAVGCTCGIFWAWLVFWAGVVFGLFSLAMAVIFDTSLADHVNFD